MLTRDRIAMVAVAVFTLAACDAQSPSCEQRLAAVSNLKISTLTESEIDTSMLSELAQESSEGARIVHYRDVANVLRRVAVTYYGEGGRRELDYRLIDMDTFTLEIRDVAYAQPISPSRPTKGGNVTRAKYDVCAGSLQASPGDAKDSDDVRRYVEQLAFFANPGG